MRQNYSNTWLFVWAIIFILLTAFGWALSGCSAYKGISKHPPATVKDSTRLAERFSKTFPPAPPKLIPGKTITKTVVKEDTKKVTDLQKRVDSLIDANDFTNELLSSVPKIDSLKAAIRKEIMKDCKPKETIIDNSTTDTLYFTDPALTADLFGANKKVIELSEAKERNEATIASYKAERDSVWWVVKRFFTLTWWFWALLIGGSAVWAYFKFKTKIPFLP